MTKQEQVKEILEVIKHCGDYTNRDCAECDYRLYGHCNNQKQCEAEALYNAGYDNISEYKAEREMLGSQIKVLKQRLNDKYIEVDNLTRDYRNAFERLKSQQREIDALKAENKQLKTECALLDDELRIARQETINVLNELKTKAFDKDAFNGWAGSTFVVLVRDIDKMIEELTKCRR